MDKKCFDCKAVLYDRRCSYMPGGVVHVCPACNHEYTLHEYTRLEKSFKDTKNTGDDLFLNEGTSSGDGKKLVLGLGKEEYMTPELKTLLDEKEDSNLKNILASYENPIQEI